MPEQPLISIIIPTFNRAHLLSETLDSVLAQTYPNWECIVVDDGATDTTAALVETYIKKDARFFFHKRPSTYLSGGNGARNYGFAVSKGEYIQWFDDDDIMLKEFLKEKEHLFNADCELVICSGIMVDNALKELHKIDLKVESNLYRDYILWKLKVLTPSVLFKKSFLEGKNLFLDSLQRGQETEFFSRLFFELQKNQYVILDKPLFLYRQHEATKTSKNVAYIAAFKFSQSYISWKHLKRAIILNDTELINNSYQNLIFNFFNSLEHEDMKTSKFILKGLLPILKKRNTKIYIEIAVLGRFLVTANRGIYTIRQRWKKFII